jgi:intein/homing endonuclease
MIQNYPVLMFDGSSKSISDIEKGDVLMGPDSVPRVVKDIEVCEGEAFLVEPLNGESFILGGENYVCLQHVGEEICNIDLHISDFEKQSKHFKDVHKLHRSGVDFAIDAEITIDPYFLGSLIADGCFRGVPIKLSCGDIEPCQYAQKVVTNMGLACRFRARKGSNCFDVFAGSNRRHVNALRIALQELGLWNKLGHQKFIPDIYKLGSRNVRFATLAGLIDCDGNLSIQNSVSYCTTSKQLAEDVTFIARSLGFGATLRKPQTWLNKNWRPIYTVCIFGNFQHVPLLVTRKIPNSRRSPKNVLRTGFAVRRLMQSITYLKLVFDGNDQHYLKSDFMVMKGGDKYVI